MTDEIQPNKIYTSAQVAHLVHRRSVAWFYTWRAAHGAAEGFPPPTSPRGHPRWLGARLLAWLARDSSLVLLDGMMGGNLLDIRPLLRARSQAMAATGRKRLSR